MHTVFEEHESFSCIFVSCLSVKPTESGGTWGEMPLEDVQHILKGQSHIILVKLCNDEEIKGQR